MKVLVLTQYFWPENFRINDLALGLKARGHQVEVLTGMPNYPAGRFFAGYGVCRPQSEDYRGISVQRVPLFPRGAGRSIHLVLNYLTFAATASLLGPWRIQTPPDAIFVYEPSPVTVGIPALVLRGVFRIPVLFWVQDLWPHSLSATGAMRNPALLQAVDHLVRIIYKACDRVLIQSEAFRPYLRGQKVPDSKIVYFPNSAEPFYQARQRPPGSTPTPAAEKRFRIVFAGNIGEAQDFPTILGAAELLRDRPDLQWDIIGSGRRKAWVAEEIRRRRLGSNVHLRGAFPPEAMPAMLAEADVLLVTLKRDPIFSMTVPSKIQSYLACGKPIAGALEGEGARIIMAAGAGWTCAPEDPQALARLVTEMYSLPQSQRHAMGRRGQSFFQKHYDRDVLLDSLERILQNLPQRIGKDR